MHTPPTDRAETRPPQQRLPPTAAYPSGDALLALEQELLRYFRNRVPPYVDPRDLVAEVWLAMADYRGEASHRTFAFRVARLRLADFYRYRRELEPLTGLGADDGDVPDLLGRDVDTLWELFEDHDRVDRIVERLPLPFRSVVRLHLDGLDNFMIAAELGLHYNTVRSRLSRGLAKVKVAFDAELAGRPNRLDDGRRRRTRPPTLAAACEEWRACAAG